MSDEEYTCDPGYCQSLELYDHIKALTEELTVAEQRGYANAMEAERKLHEDRIEALTTERDEQIEWVKRLADMQIASEVKLATCEEIGRAFEEDAGQLRAKLAKAVAALGRAKASIENGGGGGVTDVVWLDDPCPETLCDFIDATLAEIEGEKG